MAKRKKKRRSWTSAEVRELKTMGPVCRNAAICLMAGRRVSPPEGSVISRYGVRSHGNRVSRRRGLGTIPGSGRAFSTVRRSGFPPVLLTNGREPAPMRV
jgi:hypothetical protein